MAYVLRDSQGSIKAASPTEIKDPGWSFIEGDAKEYVDFLEAALANHNPFRESDIALARVLEDLIALLIDKDLIRFTDFPEQAQKRLIDRQTLRVNSIKVDFIDDSVNFF
jgi:hypothetical protein